VLAACIDNTPSSRQEAALQVNPIAYVEVPVTDMERAIAFYQRVFATQLERRQTDGYEMAFFPLTEGAPGASVALAKGDVYIPTTRGPIVYFAVTSTTDALAHARSMNAPLLLAPKLVEGFRHIAEIEDSEGNRIALYQPAD
jgi:uncharacterized protein